MHLLSYNFGLEGYIGVLLYCGAILAFVGSFFRPALALYVMVPLLPFQTVRLRLRSYPLGLHFLDLMLFASLAGSMCRSQCKFPKTLRLPLLANIALTYVSLWKGAAYLSLPWPIWFDQVRLANWKDNVVLPVLVFVAVYSAIRTRRQMILLLVLMCLTTIAFNRNVYNQRGGDQSSFSYDSRAESGDIGANGLAAFEVQFGFLLLGIAAFERRWYVKSLYWAVGSFCHYGMMLTYSRGAYIAFIVGWAALGLLKTRKLLIGLVVFLATWQSVVPNAVRDRVLMTYTQDSGLEASAARRVTLWQDAMDVIAGDPILGTGYNTYEFMHRAEELNDTHNVYMKVLLEGGAVGLILFLLIFWRLARLGYSTFRCAEDPFFAGLGLGLLLWMICACLTNVFGDRWNYIAIVGYLWTAAAMALRGREIERVEASEYAECEEFQYATEEA